MALENAREKGWTKVQILSDAKNVVDMVLQRTIVSWEIETLSEDIWTLMKCFAMYAKLFGFLISLDGL
uniref:RNase H type-1 domain-containing protein n=1 Tax=Solanum lycopersicum TaxID=4081 RepID=A0A3Q7IGF5_SOLLC